MSFWFEHCAPPRHRHHHHRSCHCHQCRPPQDSCEPRNECHRKSHCDDWSGRPDRSRGGRVARPRDHRRGPAL